MGGSCAFRGRGSSRPFLSVEDICCSGEGTVHESARGEESGGERKTFRTSSTVPCFLLYSTISVRVMKGCRSI